MIYCTKRHCHHFCIKVTPLPTQEMIFNPIFIKETGTNFVWFLSEILSDYLQPLILGLYSDDKEHENFFRRNTCGPSYFLLYNKFVKPHYSYLHKNNKAWLTPPVILSLDDGVSAEAIVVLVPAAALITTFVYIILRTVL